MGTTTAIKARRATRRGILTKAATVSTAALAARVMSPGQGVEAANGSPILIGQGQTGTSLTEFGGDFNDAVFEVYNDSTEKNAAAVVGRVALPYALPSRSTGVLGRNGREQGNGVFGEATGKTGVGVRAVAGGEGGVALSALATGAQGFAVFAASGSGTGVSGSSRSRDHPGVEAIGDNLGAFGFSRLSGVGVFGTAGSPLLAAGDLQDVRAGILGRANGIGVAGLAARIDIGTVKALTPGIGVAGIGEGAAPGVLGRATGAGTSGVLGQGGGNGIGVQGIGTVGMSGRGEAAVLSPGSTPAPTVGVQGLGGTGVFGGALSGAQGEPGGPGVWGSEITSSLDPALDEAANTRAGVLGTSTKVGVAGVGGAGAAIAAELAAAQNLTNRVGVAGFGLGADCRGVLGTTTEASGVGMLASNPNGTALEVAGRSTFTGLATLSAGTGAGTGDATGQALRVEGASQFVGPISATGPTGVFNGDGAGLVNLNAAALEKGKVAKGRLPRSVAFRDAKLTPFAGKVSAAQFSGPRNRPPVFPSAGRAIVPAGASTILVKVGGLSDKTNVLALLQSDGGEGVTVEHVERVRGGFRAVLTKQAKKPAVLAYFVVGTG